MVLRTRLGLQKTCDWFYVGGALASLTYLLRRKTFSSCTLNSTVWCVFVFIHWLFIWKHELLTQSFFFDAAAAGHNVRCGVGVCGKEGTGEVLLLRGPHLGQLRNILHYL